MAVARLAQQAVRGTDRVGSGVRPLSGTSSRRSRTSRTLRVGASATVAPSPPPLKATIATRLRRCAASQSSAKATPLACSSIASAASE